MFHCLIRSVLAVWCASLFFGTAFSGAIGWRSAWAFS